MLFLTIDFVDFLFHTLKRAARPVISWWFPPPVGICFVHRFQLAEFLFFFSLEQWSTSAEGVRITQYKINLEVVGCRVMQSTSSPRQFFCSLFSCFVSFSFFFFLRPGPVSIAFSHGNTSAVSERLVLLKMRRVLPLFFFFWFSFQLLYTNVTMKLVKSFFGIVRHSIHNLFDSCIPIVPHPTRVTHLMLSAQSKWWNVLSTGWREFRKPFSWLAVHV